MNWANVAGPFDDPLSYPGPVPDGGYLLSGGAVEAMPADDLASIATDRRPVIATGSNASPPQLWRKLGRDAVVPVVEARATGIEVRYSAHITRYGAMPSTAWPWPVGEAEVHVLFLTGEQVAAVDRSEPTYERTVLADLGGAVQLASGSRLDAADVGVYVSKRGWYRLAGRPVLLSELDQRGVLATVLDLVRQHRSGDAPADVAALARAAKAGTEPLTPAGLTALITEAGRGSFE